jgi:outer membrane receptor protein involved in Fe transport
VARRAYLLTKQGSVMANHVSIRRAVRLALLASVTPMVLTAPAFAQEQDTAQPTQGQSMEEVVVTGSRILAPNLQSISPVTAISSEDINTTGKTRIEDVINQLPQAFAAQGASIANASTGTATVDLRGLGAQRTLVLVNGRRLMPGNPDGASAADLNQIPMSLVKRVDVLTGGASSVYGADAVAGVVNFVMDTDFEGVRIDSNYSFYNHKNDNRRIQDVVNAQGFELPEDDVNVGYSRDFSFALGIGSPEGRGHATFYATYRKVDPVLQASFDYSACTLNLDVDADDFACGGSQTADPAAFYILNPPATPPGTPDPNPAACPALSGCTFGADGVLRPFGAGDEYNFGPVNYYQRPDERYTAGVFANFKVSDRVEAYGELMYMDDRSVAQIAPSGSFFGQYNVNCDNPYWSDSMRQQFCGAFGLGPEDFGTVQVGRRNTEGGGRQDDIGHDSYRVVAGVRGDINDMLSFDVYLQQGETKRNSTYLNDFSIRRTGLALNARTDADGEIVCLVNSDADPANDDPNCVPWNIWQAGGVNPDALAYLQTPGFQRALARQEIAHADITADFGDSVRLPSADSGLVVNVGAEYRDEKTDFQTDLAFSSGDLAGQGGATLPVHGRYDVSEGFVEARMPLVEGKTGAQSLSAEAGYRYSDYSSGFTTNTYKAGIDWAPIDMLRFRGSYQRAVRAPNVGELFSSPTVLLDGTQDPCAGAAEDLAFTAEQCALTGVSAAQYGNIAVNPAGQYNGLLGGNADLTAEKSDTFSAGVVIRPNLGDLSVAIDYFDISIDQTISSTLGGNADAYITNCLNTGLPEFCGRIHRDSTGSLWRTLSGYIDDISANIGERATSGVDLQASYTLNVGEQRIGFNLIGTWLNELSTAPVEGLPAYDCVGYYGGTCTVPAPEWRHSLRTNWRTPWNGLDVALTWRYVGDSTTERLNPSDQLSGDVNENGIATHISAYSYFDLTASMTLAERFTLRLGANNLFDKEPPIVTSGAVNDCPTGPCNGNTWAQVYDALGRQFFATLTIDF